MESEAVSADRDRVNRADAWLKELVLIDGDEFFAALLHEISLAQTSVCIETYIIETGAIEKRLFDALRCAAQRGVQVSLLVDGVGSAQWISTLLGSAQLPPFPVRVFHPLPWQAFPQLKLISWSGLKRLFELFGIANRRDHRKMAVIDGRSAFVGSMNISDVHAYGDGSSLPWHDVAIRVESQDCKMLEALFLTAWERSWVLGDGQTLLPPNRNAFGRRTEEHPLVLQNDSRFVRFKAYSRRLKHISSARHRVWIANAYFVPSHGLQRALMRAASRGVDVRILLTAESDVRFMPWIARTHYAALVRSGVRLFEYQARVLHSKVLFVDEFAIVGSSNLNHRSLLHDLELDVLVRESETVERIHKMFQNDFLDAVEVDCESLTQLSVWQELVVTVLLVFRRVL